MKTLLSLLLLCCTLCSQAYALDTDTGESPDIQYSDSNYGLSTLAGQLATPAAIYEYVRNSDEYALYHGARAGSLGAYMALRGNDVDLAAYLIAMLRSQGIPARYVVGTVRMPSTKVMAWLGVEDASLAASLLKDQGIQNVVLSTDKTTIDFEHVWAEASVAPDAYRGTRQSTTSCSSNRALCNWIPLDPSFKQYAYNKTNLDPYQSGVLFDYTSYYNAIAKNDLSRRDKNPLEIYQEQLLTWLTTNSPGKTLADIPDYKNSIAVNDGILPSSPPFSIVNTPRRYNSVSDHDLAVPSIESKKWNKTASIQIQITLNNGTTTGIYTIQCGTTGSICGSASLIDLATKTLTISTEMNGSVPNMVVRLDGVEIARPIVAGLVTGFTPSLSYPFRIIVSMDGTPATSSSTTDHVISATYSGIVGGYYLVATGGETSNWNQVYGAASQLLQANRDYPIVFNSTESGCDVKTHIGCTPYVDTNASGAWNSSDPTLLSNQPAMDALTKGLLNVAARQYYVKLRESFAQLDALNKTKSPIEGFLGVVSSTYSAEYIDGTAYSILPGGLLIDMKGINLSGSWRIDQPNTYSNSQIDLMGHVVSSLEHEVWQELTGYDAISTVRGIQMALAADANTTLLNPKRNSSVDTLPGLYPSFGFGTSTPAGFTKNAYNIFGGTYYGWSTATTGADFFAFSPNTQGIVDQNNPLIGYLEFTSVSAANDNLSAYASNYNYFLSKQTAATTPVSNLALTVNSALFQSDYVVLAALQNTPSFTLSNPKYARTGPTAFTFYVNSNGVLAEGIYSINIQMYLNYSGLVSTTFTYTVHNNGDLTCGGQTYTNQTPSVLLSKLQTCFNNYTSSSPIYFGLTGSGVNLEYRAVPSDPYSNVQSTKTVLGIRDQLNGRDITNSWVEYLIPSKMSVGPNYRFEVDIQKTYNATNNNIANESFEILNQQGIAAGGGYVDGTQPLTTATAIALPNSSTSVLPTFNNATLNTQNTINEVNNNVLKTPSTADPVSTVTGNNYHDETDFVIKGRGLNYAFTRTYNSAPSSTKVDIGLGYGWTHSYGMKLKSNDYGNCPDCTSAQDAVNGNSKTSSLTFTDERGGDHNYLVNESSLAVTAPSGEFDSLTFDSNTQVTLTYRNGTRYVFEYLAGTATNNLQKTPGLTARLKQIVDAYGNQLNFTYDATAWPGKLVTVTDNLAISGRTGLTFSYDTTNHLKSVTDWSGRSWAYAIDVNSNLASMTNPLNKSIVYKYGGNYAGYNQPATMHNLLFIFKPEYRTVSGYAQQVSTFFSYYRNGKTFFYQDTLSNTEILDYDLYRKTTRVTDPNGDIRTYEYDQSGRMTKLIEPDGGELFFNNSPDGLRYNKTDGLGYLTQYSYKTDKSFNTASDTFGNVTREQDALLQNIDTTYGIYDQVATVTDKRGVMRTNTYYATTGSCGYAGKLQNVKLSKLTVNGTAYTNVLLEDYCWNADGTLASKNTYIDPAVPTRKRVTTYTYQAGSNGLNVSQITVSGSGVNIIKTFGYDNLGRKTSETMLRATSATNSAQLSLTTSYEYDALDRNTAVIDALGNRMETVYDGNGQISQIIARYKKGDGTFNSRTLSTRVYDEADRLYSDTDVYGKTTNYSYDSNSNIVSLTDANGHVTKYEYDAMNRRTAVTDANGSRTEMNYDLAGHVISLTNANKETISNLYDKLGRLTQNADAMGFVSNFGYDANNNLTCIIDANAQAGLQQKNTDGCSETRIYDELNRVSQVNNAINGVTKTTYDLLGNVASITDASNKTTTNTYDDLGRLVKVTDPLIETPTDKVDTYTYDEAGNVLTNTNRLGQVTRTSYDQLNRPYKTEYLTDGKTDSVTYDIYGNPYQIANASVTYTLLYDNKNRLTKKTDGRLGKSLSFTYDNVGNILTKTDYQNFVTEYRYDSTNQLVSLKNPDFLEVSYQYDAAGRQLSRILSNGAQTSTTYDKNGWPFTLKHLSANGTVVGSTSYTRDRVGNILTQIDSSGNTTFTYDALYRIKAADYPGTAFDESFTYDAVGNRQTQILNGATHAYELYPSSNRLKAVHTSTLTGAIEKAFTYDDAGRMTIQTGAGAKTFTWNQKDQASLMGVNGKTINYTYDPLSFRIGTSGSSSGTLDYYREGEHLEAIYAGSQLQSAWLRGKSTDELVAGWVTDASSAANPSSATIGTPYIYAHDNQNSVAGISGHDGGTLEQMTYTAFGLPRADIGNAGTITANTLRYTGREQDSDSGLYYYRARYYDPSIGRFPSEDPLGFQQGVNFYAYVNNNPINYNDPSGMGLTNIAEKGVEIILKLRNDWNEAQILAAQQKVEALNNLAADGRAIKSAVQDGPSASSIWTKAGNTKNQGVDIDHTLDKQLGGSNDLTNLSPLDSSVNRSFGSQIAAQLRDHPIGTVVTAVGLLISDSANAASKMNISDFGSLIFDLSPLGDLWNAVKIKDVGAGSDIVPRIPVSTPGFSDGSFSFGIGGSAAGGYLLYPNKLNNNNMIHSVYSK